MQLSLTHGTFLFLITIIISTNLSQNGEVQGASVALEAANAKELAIAGKVRYKWTWDWFGVAKKSLNFNKSFFMYRKLFHFQIKLLQAEKFEFEIHEAIECDSSSH